MPKIGSISFLGIYLTVEMKKFGVTKFDPCLTFNLEKYERVEILIVIFFQVSVIYLLTPNMSNQYIYLFYPIFILIVWEHFDFLQHFSYVYMCICVCYFMKPNK